MEQSVVVGGSVSRGPALVAGFGIVGREDRLDAQLEESRDGEGEWKGGVVSSGLDCVDGLSGHFEFLRKVGLAPGSLGSQDAQLVLHAVRLFFARALPAAAVVMIKPAMICARVIATKDALALNGGTSPCTSAIDQTNTPAVRITAETA